VDERLLEEFRRDRLRNLEDAVRHAKWEAEMVRRLGPKWFEARDKWLWEALEADRRLWRDPRIREALLKAILAKSRGREAL